MADYEDALAPGTPLNGLVIQDVLGKGAFGITYLAQDPTLEKKVAVKEYYPASIATRRGDGSIVANAPDKVDALADGMEKFIEEARTVARLRHPNIVEVQSFFEANGTAYMVMQFYEGHAFHEWLAQYGSFSQDQMDTLLPALMDALSYMHARGVIHRDIKPANVYITHAGEPILLDFGAAKEAIDGSTQTGTKIGSAGYAALEQSSSRQKLGPWTDIYGLSATFYRMTTGETPPPADERGADLMDGGRDPYVPIVGRTLRKPLDERTLIALDAGMALNARDRPQAVEAWQKVLDGAKPPSARGQVFDPASVTTGPPVEVEGRQWGTIITVALVMVALLGATGYLIISSIGDGTEPPQITAETDPAPGPDVPEPATASPSAEAEAYARAVEIDTLEAFRDFLDQFPDGELAPRAQQRINEFDEEAWAEALADNTEAAYQDYLDDFPTGLHAAEARAILKQFEEERAERQRQAAAAAARERELWTTAQRERTIEAVDAYLTPFPAGTFAPDARLLRRELQDDQAWAAAQQLDNKTGYEGYLTAHPQGRHAAEALAELERFILRPGKIIQDCADCPSLIVVDQGSFNQGANAGDTFAKSNEKPAHVVAIPAPFAIGTHEVTFAEYDRCVAAGACPAVTDDGGFGRDNRPVINVSWSDALAYTAWLTEKTSFPYDLPSESQWEYAARGGNTGAFLGNDTAGVCDYANGAGAEVRGLVSNKDCEDPIAVGTLPAGQLKANDFGLYDVLGNVAEWTRDCLTLNYRGAPSDGSAKEDGLCGSRVTRGGSWRSDHITLRLSARANARTGTRNDQIGFRVVRGVAR